MKSFILSLAFALRFKVAQKWTIGKTLVEFRTSIAEVMGSNPVD